MSIEQTRQPQGVPTGGQFATGTRTEAVGVDLIPTGPGLDTPGNLDEPTRQLVDALEAAGLNGTVTPSPFTSTGWARVDIELPSGHELSVGVARTGRGDEITAVTATLRATDDIGDEDDIDVQSFGGGIGEVAIGEAVQQALIASAARAEFADRFPNAAANGCIVEWIGQENAPTSWHKIQDPSRQMDGARFALPGGGVLVTTLNGDVELAVDDRTLGAKDSYLRELAAADVTRRLGIEPAEPCARTLATTVADVIAAGWQRPVCSANLRRQP